MVTADGRTRHPDAAIGAELIRTTTLLHHDPDGDPYLKHHTQRHLDPKPYIQCDFDFEPHENHYTGKHPDLYADSDVFVHQHTQRHAQLAAVR